MTAYRIAVIPGDGIGREVVPVALAALRRAGELTDRFHVETTDLDWSCERFLREGSMMPPDGLRILDAHDAILVGAVGFPGVADHVSLWGLLLPIRQGFDQYVNLRPIRVLPGIVSPLRNGSAETVDMLFVRENTEGEYSGIGGRFHAGAPEEVALQTSVYTRRGIERVVRFAFERARERSGRLASATKSNALQYSAVLWDEVVADIARDFPDVRLTKYLVDALAARFVYAPETVDVVVASNLYGDVLTDLGAALQGSLGLAASANLNPERTHPSMFEPVHGSAPDVAGKDVANPMATAWAGAMLLEHLGEAEGAALVMGAIEHVAAHGPHTPDVGGTSGTRAVGAAIVAAMGS
ncbi:MAG: tartrate dehydrogenase [Chloroflexota bacterium]|nr:tartrate dehydrogenase [Chloroflexota bacterium]